MIPGPEVVDNELRDSHRTSEASSNSNISTGVTGIHIKLDEATDIVIDEDINSVV